MYEAKNFEHLLGLNGFSDTLLRNHFALYEGYVSNTNKILDLLKTADSGAPLWHELKRRFGWEWNGMRLHELYFENIGKTVLEIKKNCALAQKIDEDFGVFSDWEKDFRAVGMTRGVGWVILAQDNKAGKLFNIWVNEHDGGHLAGASILLIMDAFEHAFLTDYGIKRTEYINAFMSAIDWGVVEKRFSDIFAR